MKFLQPIFFINFPLRTLGTVDCQFLLLLLISKRAFVPSLDMFPSIKKIANSAKVISKLVGIFPTFDKVANS